MIRAGGTSKDGTPLVMLGLEEENMNRLREGQPITINLRTFDKHLFSDLPDIDIVVFFVDEEARELLSAKYMQGLIAGTEEGLSEL